MKVEITAEVDVEETIKTANLVLKKVLESHYGFSRSVIIATIAQNNHLLDIFVENSSQTTTFTKKGVEATNSGKHQRI